MPIKPDEESSIDPKSDAEKINEENHDAFLKKSIRKVCTDYWFNSNNVDTKKYKNILFTRLVASGKTKFTNVDFSYSIFDHAYMRDCSFDNCKFVGCKFLNSNFSGSSFLRCDFRYTFFDKTIVDYDILDSNFPIEKNLKYRFLKTIRINFQQLGDNKNVNKVMILELSATYEYLKEATFSNKAYYQKKYGGFWKRTQSIFNLLNFMFWDLLWGNGEKIFNLVRSFILVLTCIVIYDMSKTSIQNANSIEYLIGSIFRSISIFFSVEKPSYFSDTFITIIIFIRLFLFALFISILVKRLNRR